MVDDGLSIRNSLLPFAVFKWLVGRAGDQRKEFFLVQPLTMFACWVQPPIGRGRVLAINVDNVSGGRINNPSVPHVGLTSSPPQERGFLQLDGDAPPRECSGPR